MRSSISYISFFLLLSLFCHCQITQLSTGTTTHLYDLSVIDNNILINGRNNYIRKSLDGCNNLSTINSPSPINYLNRIQRIDTGTIFLLSYHPNQSHFYRSTDGGYNWTEKLDTNGSFRSYLAFFDSLTGFISNSNNLMRTNDGGKTWTNLGGQLFDIGISAIKTYDDSLVCIGGFNVTNEGFYFSKNRGQTWMNGGGIGGDPTDFYFLNRDTIFGVTLRGAFFKSTNGGAVWDDSGEPPISECYGVKFKNSKEGYIVGATSQSMGLVLKTTDLGKTWASFNTGIKTTLFSIAFLNDSIALLTGTDGVLLRWNYKNAVFTNTDEVDLEDIGTKIFPNPATDNIRFDNILCRGVTLSISTVLGQTVLSKSILDKAESVDIKFLAKGIYYVQMHCDRGHKILKLIKE